MNRALFSWIGKTDLNCSEGIKAGRVPLDAIIAHGLEIGLGFSYVTVLHTPDLAQRVETFISKMKASYPHIDIRVTPGYSDDPTDYKSIYEVSKTTVDHFRKTEGGNIELFFNVTSGAPAMHAVWLLLSRSLYQARLLQVHRETGVTEIDLPFELSEKIVSNYIAGIEQNILKVSEALYPETVTFDTIPVKSTVMKEVMRKGRRLARLSLPVLVEGETGTGKESFSRALHNESPRRDKPFFAVNCGAFTDELIRSELFGYERGAFTGAVKQEKGIFEKAAGGTVFLDEIGELSLNQQVSLLRALAEKKILRMGGAQEITVDVCVIGATNRDLLSAVSKGSFRDDLYYRLAVGKIMLPSLRERGQDEIDSMIDMLLNECNDEIGGIPGFVRKELSDNARAVLLDYPWPGNIRELKNVLDRLCMMYDERLLSAEMVKAELSLTTVSKDNSILDVPFTEGFKLNDVVDELVTHYYRRALQQTGGNKAKAARLLGVTKLNKKWIES